MNRFLCQVADYACVAEYDAFHGIVIRQHGDYSVTPASVRHLSGMARPPVDQRLRFGGSAVVDTDVVAAIQKARCHSRSHVAKPDYSDFHLSPRPVRQVLDAEPVAAGAWKSMAMLC
jgi:hypothetical protein